MRLSGGTKTQIDRKLPSLDERLCQVLANRDGKFEDYASSDVHSLSVQIDTCPDIVVMDDLDVEFRRLELDLSGQSKARTRLRRYKLQDYVTRDSFDDNRKCHLDLLSLLFERFAEAKRVSVQKGVPILEPVIIGSIKNDPATALRAKNVWWTVANDNWLRKRTIIMLDAEDLRQAGLAISTGLSWERTAQDTISQLRQSKDFRPFLDFGQLIIRYGVTGALQISRSPDESQRSYMLHFDPKNDDMTWTNDETDGVVLGYTSVYAATLVRSLLNICRRDQGHPFLGDLTSCVSTSIIDAIKSCQRFEQSELW